MTPAQIETLAPGAPPPDLGEARAVGPAPPARSPSPPPGAARPWRRRTWSLRREIVVGYSTVLLIALMLFAFGTWLILRQTLARTATQSLRQTAAAAEQLVIPSNIPRLEVKEERLPPAP
ncbi:MAG TPA: hypothetical protein VF541_10770, partial [Longimicrobium sp.]